MEFLQELNTINNFLNKNYLKLKEIEDSICSENGEISNLKSYLKTVKKMKIFEIVKNEKFQKLNKKLSKLEEKEKILKEFNKILNNNKNIIIEKILLNEFLKLEILKKLDNKKIGEKREIQLKEEFKKSIEPFFKNFELEYGVYLNLKLGYYWEYVDFKANTYSNVLRIQLKDNFLNLEVLKKIIEERQKELNKIFVKNVYRYILNSFKNAKKIKELEKEKCKLDKKILELKKESF